MTENYYDLIAGLPLEIEGHQLEGLRFERASGDFERLSTVIRLTGAGKEGVGEDVTYGTEEQIAFRETGEALDLSGQFTIESFSALLDGLELFPAVPSSEAYRSYRRWALESAALDLALRQAGESLHGLLGIEPHPVTFVISMRLESSGEGDSPEFDSFLARLSAHPGSKFKLDPTNDWTDELIERLASSGAVDSLDLKGHYSGTVVDVETDPDLYRRLIEAFPDAWLEDPDVNEATRPILDPVSERITWDAPIHSVADIEAAPWKPRMVNIKPSRFGTLKELFSAYAFCAREGIAAYGGGQWELGPGRGQIQYLASLFHPDTPNDTAPSGYNTDPLDPNLPSSPLKPDPASLGFRWGE
jgi:L-alanine-DL-glutamate epimerase-like enolase superfamily enzyme